MAELYLGDGMGGVVLRPLTDGRLTGTFSASLFPSTHPPLHLVIGTEVRLYLEYNDKPDGTIGITGAIIRFEEVSQ